MKAPVFLNQMWKDESMKSFEPAECRFPTLIMWNYGGSDVAVEGPWDNWTSRRWLQRSGKDHSVLLALPSCVYRYRFIVDGEQRYVPDLPSVADEMGHICNLLDVHDNVSENVESVKSLRLHHHQISAITKLFWEQKISQRSPWQCHLSSMSLSLTCQTQMRNLTDRNMLCSTTSS